MIRVAVCSKSFSKNKVLREELLRKFHNVKFNDEARDLRGADLVEFLAGCERAIVGLEKITEDVLKQLPDLRVISKYGVGLDGLDFAALKKFGIRLGWTAGVNRRSVAELALGHMIACLRHLYSLNNMVKAGQWQVQFGGLLSSRRVGILGLGHVGQDLALLLKAFGCEIWAHDIADRSEFSSRHQVKMDTLENLMKESDILTVHVPLDDSTRNLLGEKNLSFMKPESILINTARGNIVDQRALFEVLKNKRIAAAAFDVFDVEPPVDRQLIDLPNFFASPHVGGSSSEAVLAMGRAAIAGLDQAKELE